MDAVSSILLPTLVALLLSIRPASCAKPHSVFIRMYTQSLDVVTLPPLLLPYRNGPIMSGGEAGQLSLYLIWYGSFQPAHRSTILDFLHSLDPSQSPLSAISVSSWWSRTAHYKDSSAASVPSRILVAGESFDGNYSLGMALNTSTIEALVKNALVNLFPATTSSLYFVLTSQDVTVDGFCLDSCGYHAYTFPSPATQDKMLVYAWVGNPASQCPEQCAWPFKTPIYGPKTPPLLSPNGDVGIDGMLISIATVLAGAATNPYDTGYYQGDPMTPLEAVSACAGIFGKGAYPGYPGELLVHNTTGASYNAEGINDRRFLVPAMWNPTTLNCVTL